jgi:protease-4
VAGRRGVGLVLFLIGTAVVISAAGLALSWAVVGRQPSVPPNASLVLRVGSDLSEQEPTGVLSPFLEKRPTLRSAIDALRRAKTDARITGLLILPSETPALWGKTQELRDAILDFKSSRKPVTAFLEYGGDQEYYLATAADRVFLLPTSTLDLKGLASYELFLRGSLDKIGALPDFIHVGDFKTAPNIWTETGFTPAHREMAESLNNDLFDQLVGAIAASRKKTPEEVRALVDEGPFLPEDALRAGLIDGLAYQDQLDEQAKLGKGKLRPVELGDYAGGARRPGSGFGRRGRIALVLAVGTIMSGRSGRSAQGDVLGSQTLADAIRKVRDDDSIKAVVVRIDSPGGSTVASDVIWRELMLTRAKKPVVASMSDVAASGGYYIAMPAHVIVAEPGTLTGSIGVLGGKFVVAGTLEKLGANVEGVAAGRHADIYSPLRPFSPEERAKLESQMEAFYDQFVEKVASARRSTPERIDAIAQGRVWTGRQAKEIGLVDELGGLSRAIAIARERAKLPAEGDIDLVVYPPRKSLYEMVADPLGQAGEARGAAAWGLLSPDERRVASALLVPWRLLRRGEPLALMPFVQVR